MGKRRRRLAKVGTQQLDPFEEYMVKGWKALPQQSNFNIQQIRDMFKVIVKEMSLTITSLNVAVTGPRIQAQVTFDVDRNVTLNYNNYFFNTLTEDQIKAILSHESCHIATLPDSSLLAPSPDSLQANFIEIYDEYLAHKEFARRFKDSTRFQAYADYKTRDFSSYENIVEGIHAQALDPARALLAILNDAIYFPVVGDGRFLEWCRKNKLSDLARFLNWIVQDFKFIEDLKLDRVKTMETLLIEGALSFGVNGMVLLKDNRIVFVDSAEEAEKRCAVENGQLVNIWAKRRLARDEGIYTE
jgi:hypothetical protein